MTKTPKKSAQRQKQQKLENPLFDLLTGSKREFDSAALGGLLEQVSRERVHIQADVLAKYLSENLPKAIDKREGLFAFKTNPYVLMTSSHIMQLRDPAHLAAFLFNTKLYMGLETSFGKSIESKVLQAYPLIASGVHRWGNPPEKNEEDLALKGLSREAKAQARRRSVWREIDRSCVVDRRRFMTSIKSGPHCINDTQVQAMTEAIINNSPKWLEQTAKTYAGVDALDIVVGITYGTDRTTNNKENQILAKLIGSGFEEEDRQRKPGILINAAGNVRVYRRIGADFWSFIGDPVRPHRAEFVFLEVLLALAKALSVGVGNADLATRINLRTLALGHALSKVLIPSGGVPEWMGTEFKDEELSWFMNSLSAFYDKGI